MTLRLIEQRLAGTLPGLRAQLHMVPQPRPGDRTYLQVEGTCLRAGVLILLFPRKGRLLLLLMRRPEGMLHHGGQISLPGGEMVEPETLTQTAIREAEEELGIKLGGLRILGHLTPLYIPPSNYCIYPTVAYLSRRPALKPHQEEVVEVIELPLDHLIRPDSIRREVWKIRGEDVQVPFYAVKKHKVWGATAMVLAEFVEIINPSREESPN